MSRSNPVDNTPNPCTRWFEWNGEKGNLRYYNKELKENVEVDLPFQFVLLDRLSTISGWHNNSESGIFSNEVRDTRNEVLIVKAFKLKEPIAEGFYIDIRDKVKANGGKFTINTYIAYSNGENEIELGSLRMHGAAMSAWIEFENDKAVRSALYTKGIKVASTAHGEKGSGKNKIQWEAPVFELTDVPEHVNDEATELDRHLQNFLRNYFKRTRVEQAQTPEDEANAEMAGVTTNGGEDEPEQPF